MDMNNHCTEKLFSYGVLQDESVQLRAFGRKLNGTKDNLIGYQLSTIEVHDTDAVATSGTAVHPILIYTGNRINKVAGMVFDVTPEELKRADAYEVTDYERISVHLQSGVRAWVYIHRTK